MAGDHGWPSNSATSSPPSPGLLHSIASPPRPPLKAPVRPRRLPLHALICSCRMLPAFSTSSGVAISHYVIPAAQQHPPVPPSEFSPPPPPPSPQASWHSSSPSRQASADAYTLLAAHLTHAESLRCGAPVLLASSLKIGRPARRALELLRICPSLPESREACV
jgi:hypothetical protein